jgi:hypothetical protein
MKESPVRPIRDLCISSADSSFVFGPAEDAIWYVSPPSGGRIVFPPDPKLAETLEATAHLTDPKVHVTFECDGQMYHGLCTIQSLKPESELQVIDNLVGGDS